MNCDSSENTDRIISSPLDNFYQYTTLHLWLLQGERVRTWSIPQTHCENGGIMVRFPTKEIVFPRVAISCTAF